jgi:hypothetical protein
MASSKQSLILQIYQAFEPAALLISTLVVVGAREVMVIK